MNAVCNLFERSPGHLGHAAPSVPGRVQGEAGDNREYADAP